MDNTALSWGEALAKLAAEAAHDAGEHDTSLALHECLNDLANVARSYAGRLEGIVKTEMPIVADPLSKLAGEPIMAGGVEFELPQRRDLTAVEDRMAAIEERLNNPPKTISQGGEVVDLPEWLLAALQSIEERLTNLEARANFNTVAPGAFALDALMPLDDDRTAWDSIDRARNALRGMAAREHKDRAAIRQKVLEAVASLAREPDLAANAQASAELRQHEARAEELALIDAILGVKFDEIAALDDLELARAFDVTKGWPS